MSADAEKAERADAIIARETAIYGDAERRRDELLAEVAEREDAAAEKARDTFAKQRMAERRLSKVQKQLRSAKRKVSRSTLPGEGTFIVGKDIDPGTYTSTGGEACYWARLNKSNEIIDNDLVDGGQSVVTIQVGDFAVKTSGCDNFKK